MKKNQKNLKFSDRLRFLRQQRGCSREDLAQKLGLNDQSQISRYERAKAYPPVPALAIIAEVLQANLHWLITGEPSPDAARWREDCISIASTALVFIDLLNQRIDEDRGNLVSRVLQSTERASKGENINPEVIRELEAQIEDKRRQLERNRQTRDQILERIYGKSTDQPG